MVTGLAFVGAVFFGPDTALPPQAARLNVSAAALASAVRIWILP